MDKLSEKIIMLQLAQGIPGALSKIYGLYAGRLLHYVRPAAPCKEDAEEIVHDILLSLWKMRSEIDVNADLESLLFSIAHRKRIDAFRRFVHAPIYEDYINYCNSLPAQTNSTIEYKEFLHYFKVALQNLSSRHRDLILLSKLKGMSNTEIAEKLGLAEKTVRNNLSSGLKQFKKELENITGQTL